MRNHEFYERTRCENLRCGSFYEVLVAIDAFDFHMMHLLVRSHDEWSLLDRPQLVPQLPPALKERFGAPEEERLGHVGTPEHIGRLTGIRIYKSNQIGINKSFWKGNPFLVESNSEHLSAHKFRWPFVCQASLRFWVNGEEKAHSFPAFRWAKGDLTSSKSTQTLIIVQKITSQDVRSFLALLHISKRHKERNIMANWSAGFTVCRIGGDFGAISSDHKLGWIFAVSPGSHWHQDWLWRGTRLWLEKLEDFRNCEGNSASASSFH